MGADQQPYAVVLSSTVSGRCVWRLVTADGNVLAEGSNRQWCSVVLTPATADLWSWSLVTADGLTVAKGSRSEISPLQHRRRALIERRRTRGIRWRPVASMFCDHSFLYRRSLGRIVCSQCGLRRRIP